MAELAAGVLVARRRVRRRNIPLRRRFRRRLRGAATAARRAAAGRIGDPAVHRCGDRHPGRLARARRDGARRGHRGRRWPARRNAGSPTAFRSAQPDVSAALLDALRDTDPESYAQICEALAGFDVTDRLHEIATPVLAIAGGDDLPTPPECLQRIASGVKDGRLVVLDGVGHLAPAEAPERVAELIAEHVGRPPHATSRDHRRGVRGGNGGAARSAR